MQVERIYTQCIQAPWLEEKSLTLDVLRLDEIHPVVSGNKWFKLKYYVADAIEKGATTIATFGGAWSNHLVATAFVCKQAGLQSVGFVRGEVAQSVSTTLQQCAGMGMQLIYLSREAYNEKEAVKQQYHNQNWYFVNEGGYGRLGANGAAEILAFAPDQSYTHIIAAAGTGTMLAGLINSADSNQHVVGISSLKGYHNLQNDVNRLVIERLQQPKCSIFHDYHFGGYAKHPPLLIDFINEAWRHFQLPLDIVYTGKLFFAIIDLARKNFFAPGSKLLMIHSGGLQGNKSLAKNRLYFF